jgi:hypothetical protein
MQKTQINLEGSWIGTVCGTSYGNVFAKFAHFSGGVQLELRMPSSGPNVSIFVGIIPNMVVGKAEEISVTLSEKINEIATGLQVVLIFQVMTEDVLQGGWEATNGAKGFIQLYRYKSISSDKNISCEKPIEIIAREYKFGNLRIYKKDVQDIVKIMEGLITPDGFVFVTFDDEGTKKTNLARVFLEKSDIPNKLSSLIVSAQRNVNGLTHSLVLNLMKEGASTLSVQSPDLLWSYSTPMVIKELLDKRCSKTIEFYRKYGLILNTLFFSALLIFMPNTKVDRAIWVGSFLLFASLHAYFHKRDAFSIINPRKERPSEFKEKHPSIFYVIKTIINAFFTLLVGSGANIILEHWKKILSFLHINLGGTT